MENGAAADGEGIPGAWRYFHDRIEEWVTDDGEARAEQKSSGIEALQTCLDSLLYVVSINLDESDNAQVIFETLNARGTGLGALDLVKNATFLQAEREEAPAESLHDEHWEPTFEADDYWLEETRQGREKRARADWFLMHWLAMELGLVVRPTSSSTHFARTSCAGPQPRPMVELVPRLCEDARIMRSFDDFEPGTPEELFFARMEAMDTTTMFPVALLLFRSSELGRGASPTRPRCARELARAPRNPAAHREELQPHPDQPAAGDQGGHRPRRRGDRPRAALLAGNDRRLAVRRRCAVATGERRPLRIRRSAARAHASRSVRARPPRPG